MSALSFRSLMLANGFVAASALDEADDVIAELNAIAASINMPPMFYVVDGGYQLHPGFKMILRENPHLLDGIA